MGEKYGLRPYGGKSSTGVDAKPSVPMTGAIMNIMDPTIMPEVKSELITFAEAGQNVNVDKRFPEGMPDEIAGVKVADVPVKNNVEVVREDPSMEVSALTKTYGLRPYG